MIAYLNKVSSGDYTRSTYDTQTLWFDNTGGPTYQTAPTTSLSLIWVNPKLKTKYDDTQISQTYVVEPEPPRRGNLLDCPDPHPAVVAGRLQSHECKPQPLAARTYDTAKSFQDAPRRPCYRAPRRRNA